MRTGRALGIPSVATLASLILSASGCVVSVDSPVFTAREEKRFAVAGTPDLTVATFDGAIEIRSWDLPEVLVEIEKRARDEERAAAIAIKAEQAGSRIVVDVQRPSAVLPSDGFRFGGGGLLGYTGSSARLTVSVPHECNLVARSGDGSITIERVSGRIELHTADGTIRASDLQGSLRAHTGDGSMRLNDISGRADVDTDDGGIQLTGTLAVVRARTGDGSISVRAEPGTTAAEPWEIRTGDGTVTLEVPDALGAELDARTNDGSVRVEGLAFSMSGEHDRRSARGPIGSGGHTIRLRTGSGTIYVRRF